MFRFSLLHSSRRSFPTLLYSLISTSYNANLKSINYPLKSSIRSFSAESQFTSANKESTKKYTSTKLRVNTILLAFIPVLTFGLGTWQVARLRWKVKLIEDYEDRLSKPSINLPKRIK
jgi:hypothetical protein